jgi:hypothetical protein
MVDPVAKNGLQARVHRVEVPGKAALEETLKEVVAYPLGGVAHAQDGDV